jgi:hypothetical protein
MADETDKPEGAADGAQAGTSTASESSEAKERTFTQAELNAIVAREKAKAERAAEKRVRQDPEGTPKKETPPAPGSEDLAAKLAALEAKAALAEAMTELDWKPSKDDAELLREAFKNGGEAAMQKLAARLKPQAPAETGRPVDDPTKKYRDPGAPSGAPPEVLDRDATKWSGTYVEQLRSEGKLLAEVEKFRGSLPGGGGGLFRKRIPEARK